MGLKRRRETEEGGGGGGGEEGRTCKCTKKELENTGFNEYTTISPVRWTAGRPEFSGAASTVYGRFLTKYSGGWWPGVAFMVRVYKEKKDGGLRWSVPRSIVVSFAKLWGKMSN
jgi:hypothetical protein